MKKYYIYSAAVVMILFFTYKLYVYNTLKYKIVNFCKNETQCTLNMNEITNFKWDTLYVFAYHIDNFFVDEFFSSKLKHKFEYSSKLVFLYKNAVVYYDEIESRISEPPKESDYMIIHPERAQILVFNKDNAVFRVTYQFSEIYPQLIPVFLKNNPFHFKGSDKDFVAFDSSYFTTVDFNIIE